MSITEEKPGKIPHGFLFQRMEVTKEDMYVNSGYLFNSRVPFKEKKLALRILSAGTYQLHTWPRLPTWRPKGRVDWQLIYIAAGEGHFVLDGQEYRGHEFHYSQFIATPQSVTQVYNAKGEPMPTPVFRYKNVLASYTHLYNYEL